MQNYTKDMKRCNIVALNKVIQGPSRGRFTLVWEVALCCITPCIFSYFCFVIEVLHMDNGLTELKAWFADMQKSRDMKVPVFTEQELEKLPNILELIDKLKNTENDLLAKDSGWTKSFPASGKFLLNPYRVYINNADDHKFIVNRLSSGRYCLKHNLRFHKFLFRGQNQHYPKIVSSFQRQTKADKLISNIKVGDFVSMLRTHPLFMLFEHGIYLPPYKKTFFFEMNYYGLSQHYNFNTGLVDFTSDIWAAAFFATTQNNGDDQYEIYNGSSKYGVIYVHPINPIASFSALGYRTIGQQIYPRTAAQHGFFYQEGSSKMPLEKTVYPCFFRHDKTCSARIFAKMEQGKKLFPNDDLAPLSNEIRHAHSVTGEAFCDNLYFNQDDMQTNLQILKDCGITVDWHKKREFSIDMLKQYYENIKNGWWEYFCKNIAFEDKHDDELMESLIRIPQNPYYSQFFDAKQLDLLHYIMLEERRNAMRNKR